MTETSPTQPTPEEALASFATAIDGYEQRIGHACRAVAGHVVQGLSNVPAGSVVLDNACGTGAVTDVLVRTYLDLRVYASDAIPGMIAAFRAIRATQRDWQSSVIEASVMDAQDLKYTDNFFDLHIINFAIHFIQDPAKAMTEAHRTLKVGGRFVITAWRVIGFKPVLWEVQRRIKPVHLLKELPVVDRWCDGTLL